MKLTYPAIFYPAEDANLYIADFPDLPGCMTQGTDLEEAYSMAIDAASGWLLTTLEFSEPLPPSTPIEKLHLDNQAIAKLMILDLDEHLKKYPSERSKAKAKKGTNLMPQVIIT